MPVSGTAGTGTPLRPQPQLGAPAFTLKRCFGQFVSVSVPHGFHRSLTAVKQQRSGGGGAGLQAAVEGHAQGQPGQPQPRQRLLRERGQQGVQPRLDPGR